MSLNALVYPDPMQNLDMSEKTARLNMCEEQNKDREICRVKSWLTRPRLIDTSYLNAELQSYHRQLKTMFVGADGVLYRKFFQHNGRQFLKQIVIPKHLRQELLHRLHHATTQAHPGIRAVQQEFRLKFYYPNYQEDIEEYIKNCVTCAQLKSVPEKQLRPTMMGVSMKTRFPGDVMQLDLLGAFKPSAGYTHILTAIDVFSKYLFAVPLRRITSKAVKDALTTIFLQHAYIPAKIVTDQGKQFVSSLTHEVMTLFDIKLRPRQRQASTNPGPPGESSCSHQEHPESHGRQRAYRLAQGSRQRGFRAQHSGTPGNKGDPDRNVQGSATNKSPRHAVRGEQFRRPRVRARADPGTQRQTDGTLAKPARPSGEKLHQEQGVLRPVRPGKRTTSTLLLSYPEPGA